MFFKVNMSAILLQHDCISIIKFMTVLFFILLHLAHSFTPCAKITRIHNNNRTQHRWRSASKYREITGPAVALPSPCISHCQQGDTLQGHQCPQLHGCDPHHNIHSGRAGFSRKGLHSNRQFSGPLLLFFILTPHYYSLLLLSRATLILFLLSK